MTPQTQRFLHDPTSGVRGDCFRTAIACLLDLPRDDVPHVVENDVGEIQKATGAFLARHGLALMEMPIFVETADDVQAFMFGTNPGVTSYLLSGSTVRGWDHTVVVHEQCVWDPHPSRAGLSRPCDDGFWWVSALVRRDRA